MRIEIDGKFYRMRRGRLVPIPTKWLNKVTTPTTIRQRPSKLQRKVRRYDVTNNMKYNKFKDKRDAQIELVQEKDTGCYAPSCHFWDGNSECTCKREKILHFSD